MQRTSIEVGASSEYLFADQGFVSGCIQHSLTSDAVGSSNGNTAGSLACIRANLFRLAQPT